MSASSSGIVGIDQPEDRSDLDELATTVRLHGHHPPARGGLDDLELRLLLRLLHLRLHFLRLLHQLVQIHVTSVPAARQVAEPDRMTGSIVR